MNGQSSSKTWLRVKRLWSIVSGSATRPSSSDTTAAEDWDASDAHARSILISSVDRVQYQYIISLKTAKEQWDALKRVHDPPGKHRLATLLRRFFRFENGNNSVNNAAASLTSIQWRIKSLSPEDCPSDFTKAVILMDSLALEEGYETSKIIRSLDDDLSFESCVVRLLEDEEEARLKGEMKVGGGGRRRRGRRGC